jgi:hypothetical protein
MLAAAFAVTALSTTTTPTSIGVATPAFAALNCTTSGTITTCTGGGGCLSTFRGECVGGETPNSIPGGAGQRQVFTDEGLLVSDSGGSGRNFGEGGIVGGGGRHATCDPPGDCTNVRSQGQGIHVK